MRLVRRSFLLLLVFFMLPAGATAAWWQMQDRPGSWRAADWSASGVLPEPTLDNEAAIYLMAARTGGFKGAFAVHTWIVLKKPGEPAYDRYDKVGWGMPVRHNNYAADARWYSDVPRVVHAVHGERAAELIPRFEQAIAAYPFATRGAYHIWPGPNSNTFVAHVLRAVPEFGGRMPPNAIGRDFRPGLLSYTRSEDGRELHATVHGLAGFAVGVRTGIEVHLAGLVAGVDLTRPALKIPAYGRLEF